MIYTILYCIVLCYFILYCVILTLLAVLYAMMLHRIIWPYLFALHRIVCRCVILYQVNLSIIYFWKKKNMKNYFFKNKNWPTKILKKYFFLYFLFSLFLHLLHVYCHRIPQNQLTLIPWTFREIPWWIPGEVFPWWIPGEVWFTEMSLLYMQVISWRWLDQFIWIFLWT